MATFLKERVDFQRHNDEVRCVWESYQAGKPLRVPLQISGSITNFFFNPDLNTHGYTFEQFFKDPSVQIETQLQYAYWRKHHWRMDHEMGLPDSFSLYVDFQNSYDASWAGADMIYMDGYLPDTAPIFAENREKLYDMPKVLPVESGLIGQGIAFIDEMEDYCKHHDFMGRPIIPPRAYPGEGCDGVLDLAYKLRGADNLLMDMLDEDGYYEDLMEWITSNLIHRMKTLRTWHKQRWGDEPGFGFADDAIALISHETYRQYVLPYHRRIYEAFAGDKKHLIHLCGANMHHFEHLVKELPISAIDTGFPVDHGRLRKMVGPDITLYTGPTVMLLQAGSEEAIVQEAIRILKSGVTQGGKYIMIAANNLAPRTPVENIAALYDAVRTHGTYPIQ
jgi:hypothetical protein